MSRELDAQVANRIMGCRVLWAHRVWSAEDWRATRGNGRPTQENVMAIARPEDDDEGPPFSPVPAYSTDRAAAALVEDEIERRGLGDEYAMALLALKPVSDYEMGDHWFLVRATPEQRCRAALAAVS